MMRNNSMPTFVESMLGIDRPYCAQEHAVAHVHALIRKDAVSSAEDDYLRTLDEITERLHAVGRGSDSKVPVQEVVQPDKGIEPREFADKPHDGKQCEEYAERVHEPAGHASGDVRGYEDDAHVAGSIS